MKKTHGCLVSFKKYCYFMFTPLETQSQQLFRTCGSTYIVDLKIDNNNNNNRIPHGQPQPFISNASSAKMTNKLQPDFLSNFLTNMIKMQLSTQPIDGFTSRAEFQKTISLDLFNQAVHIVYNEVFAVATLGPKRHDTTMQQITTRYFFSQFWCEFTKEVLTEFLEEDYAYKEQELTSFSVKNVNESSILAAGELNKRNFYLQLFRTYCDLPFEETLKNFIQVYSDVFFKEKPLTIQKYYLCQDTSREVQYNKSEEVIQFMKKAARMVKKSDMGIYEQPFKKKPHNNGSNSREELQNGLEFFFSNVMLKCYQVPVLFTQSSEDELINDQVGTFIVMFFEKSVRKRTFAKTATQKQRLRKTQDLRAANKQLEKSGRILEDSLYHRESKMRRFCNYFVTLFHQKKLNPFSQFVNAQILKQIKQKVRDKMNQFTEDDNVQDDSSAANQDRQQSIETVGDRTGASKSRKQTAEVQKPQTTIQKQQINQKQAQSQTQMDYLNSKIKHAKKSSINNSQANLGIDITGMPQQNPSVKNPAVPQLEQEQQTTSQMSMKNKPYQRQSRKMRQSQQNYDAFISDNIYGQIDAKNKAVKRGKESNGEENKQTDEIKKMQKSRSVLSRYMSSKQGKNSYDFDEITPSRRQANNGGASNQNINSNKNSRHGFYDYADQRNIQVASSLPQQNHISRISSYEESDEIDAYEDLYDANGEEQKLQPPHLKATALKTYAGKKNKSRQLPEVKQDSTKFQTAQFGMGTLSPKAPVNVGPPTLANDDVKAVMGMNQPLQNLRNNVHSNINSNLPNFFDPLTDRSSLIIHHIPNQGGSHGGIRDQIRNEVQQDYYNNNFSQNTYRGSFAKQGTEEFGGGGRSEYGQNADSMLSLYNKIPDHPKHIQFYSSEVSQEFKRKESQLSNNMDNLNYNNSRKNQKIMKANVITSGGVNILEDVDSKRLNRNIAAEKKVKKFSVPISSGNQSPKKYHKKSNKHEDEDDGSIGEYDDDQEDDEDDEEGSGQDSEDDASELMDPSAIEAKQRNKAKLNQQDEEDNTFNIL